MFSDIDRSIEYQILKYFINILINLAIFNSNNNKKKNNITQTIILILYSKITSS